MYKLTIDPFDRISKVQQITLAITRDIERGILKTNERLPSITEFSRENKIARDTVEKAYNRLKEDGYLVAVPGKGNYVAKAKDNVLKILIVLNKLSSYKKEVYDAFIKKLGTKANVNLQIHHYNPRLLREIIENNKNDYHYYVIMPHFFHDADEIECLDILQSIPSGELVLLDKNLSLPDSEYISVYQDFKQDIYEALVSAARLFEKYKSITIVFPQLSHHPVEITEGVEQFCREYKKKFFLVSDSQQINLKPGHVYITLTESELADLIKKIRVSDLMIGEDVGVISFNETVLKELLDITVITTDFEAMGSEAASLILNKEFKHVRNPSSLIIRKSL